MALEAETALKAQQDKNGVDIATNYAKIANPTFVGTVTAPTFSGNLSGNVTGNLSGTATKATQDGNGATIASTYAKLSGATFTNWIYATGFKVNSDLNLKENLVEIKDALEKCKTLKGYTNPSRITPRGVLFYSASTCSKKFSRPTRTVHVMVLSGDVEPSLLTETNDGS